nr:hypothetical protein [Tanacetum cinerariifolium]
MLAQKDTYTPDSTKPSMIEHAGSSSRGNPLSLSPQGPGFEPGLGDWWRLMIGMRFRGGRAADQCESATYT